MSDNTPTEVFRQPEPPTSAEETPSKSKRLILLLSILGGVLLIAVVILLTLLFSRAFGGADSEPVPLPTDSMSPSLSPSPSETPSTSPSASPNASPSASAPPPPSTTTAINSFTVGSNSVLCNTETQVSLPIYLVFRWSTANASQIGFGVATNDGIAAGMGYDLPPSGNSRDNFPPGQNEIEFPCPSASQFYTLTVIGPDGKFSKTITVTNNGDR